METDFIPGRLRRHFRRRNRRPVVCPDGKIPIWDRNAKAGKRKEKGGLGMFAICIGTALGLTIMIGAAADAEKLDAAKRDAILRFAGR